MNQQRIGFVFNTLGITGGVHVIYRWAQILVSLKYQVDIIVLEYHPHLVIGFLDPKQAGFEIINLSTAKKRSYHLILATWWETLYALPELSSQRYGLFAQALESQFYNTNDPRILEYDLLMSFPLPIITIAHWLKNHYIKTYGIDDSFIQVAINPIDHHLFNTCVENNFSNSKTPTFLIEGNAQDPRKNIPLSIQILESTKTPYIWVGSKIDTRLIGPHCRGTHEQVSYKDMPKIYKRCEVLLKLSTAEGMFGPPLEMFACKKTAIVWDVAGHEEYMIHGHNSLVLPMYQINDTINAIEQLKHNHTFRQQLQKYAYQTAFNWPDWSQYKDVVKQVVTQIPPIDVPRWFNHIKKHKQKRIQRLRKQPQKFYEEFIKKPLQLKIKQNKTIYRLLKN